MHEDGFVYFLLTQDYSYMKVGFSKDPHKRLSQAQVDCPIELSIYHTIPGTKETEKSIQMSLGKHWERGQ